jgi:hypothetical protein
MGIRAGLQIPNRPPSLAPGGAVLPGAGRDRRQHCPNGHQLAFTVYLALPPFPGTHFEALRTETVVLRELRSSGNRREGQALIGVCFWKLLSIVPQRTPVLPPCPKREDPQSFLKGLQLQNTSLYG